MSRGSLDDRQQRGTKPMAETDLDVLLLAGRFEVRGSCTYTLRLAEGLAAHGVSSHIVTPDCQLVSGQLRERLAIREYGRLETPLWGRFIRRVLLRELREHPPQLIHIQSHRGLSLGTWLARRLERPVVLTVHEHLDSGIQLGACRRTCQRIIAVSESVRTDVLKGTGYPESAVVLIASGVSVPPEAECPPPLEPGHLPVVGTAGPLEVVKGFPYFLGAARQILDNRRDVEFLIAGAGPEESNLRRVARELGIVDKVTFVPYIHDFSESLTATDVFCMPSLQQGLGTVMLEAMARGRPVVATDVGGISSIVREGETGLVVPPRSSGELAQKIMELLDNPARARAMGAAARQQVQTEFSAARMVRQTAELYREIVPPH